METQSFTARRSAASTLPNFQLPPPDHLSALHSKYPSYSHTSQTQTTPSVSNVPTPPVGLGDALSPLASSINSNSSSASSSSAPAYQPQGMNYWPAPQSAPSYQYGSGPSISNAYQSYSGRPLYSPPTNSFSSRNPSSPTASEGLPPPPYDLPFPTSMASSGGNQQQGLSTLAPQHQPHQIHTNPMRSSQQKSSSQAPSQSPLHVTEPYGGRPPPTPTYYTPASTPQQPSFPAYTQQSPTQHSPNTSGPTQNRVSPVSAHSMQAPQGFPPRPYGGYNLPAMAGPIMSNIHNPGSQMALVGGNVQMQYQPHPMQNPIYHHSGQQQQQNDRPFKCDQCLQSFNRNHDLKRHKRIHLAVKPFPCGHCEKSFSRKDALKRHVLVKGCGSKGGANKRRGSQSTVDKLDVLSDSASDGSPQAAKKEL
ncbi:hypothetical protein BJ878DRAFT_413608 [Calycina marina]|uniref:C2H2-type domain-containing protein n=1 Tax=Calycina marina TaxID=1763456 RepID=A0A9P7Z9X1_9HELO|nr:hypothetical protein BJ878DRAFT_413608 [Calycina marina]